MLSVIPLPSLRRKIVHRICARLKRGGHCLFVVQYRNSDFNSIAAGANSTSSADGFVVDGLRGHSFYGVIPPRELAQLIEDGGMKVVSLHTNEGSASLWGEAAPAGLP